MSDAVELVGKLIDAYPNGRTGASKGYIGALAATLCSYPKAVALQCADPLNGVARDTRFLPTVADLVKWCEDETQSMRGIVDHDDRWATMARAQHRLAEEEAARRATQARPTYDELKAKYGQNWGITNPDVRPAPTRREAEDALIAAIGREAFDKLPNAPERPGDAWQKLKQPQREAAE